jgi:CBS domain containing-hemolysin-like protein
MESPAIGLSLFGLLVVVALILANAYFVATEFALVAVRRTQIQLWVQEGRRGARAAADAIANLDDAIAATQLGITLASIGLGFVGEPTLARLIRPLFAELGIGSSVAIHTTAVAFAFAFITFLHVVAGELAPKALALDRPGPVALWCARPLLLFGRVFRPVLLLMNGAGNALVRLFGVRPTSKDHSVHSAEELSLLVTEAQDAGAIRPYAGRILDNVFRMSRTRIRDVMIPREKVLAIDKHTDPERILELLKESGYTRLPVYDGDLDTIVGILHTKDLFHLYAKERLVVLLDAIRPPFEIPPGLSVTDALRRFRRGRKHLAIVREPGGPLLGVCTLEDVLEEIVGEIEDEFDEPTPAGSE